jgi:8-oxo-dGTP diphosphatase
VTHDDAADGWVNIDVHGGTPQTVGRSHDDGAVAFGRKEYRFCPLCGTKLEPHAEHNEIRPTCPACGFIVYYNPVPAVGGVILDGDQILLVRRAFEPKAEQWSLPSGFMEYGERQIDALAREVMEETGLEVASAVQLSVEDASDDPRAHSLMISFIVTRWRGEVTAGDDASEAAWFPITDPPDDMAWRNHTRVIEKARERLNR